MEVAAAAVPWGDPVHRRLFRAADVLDERAAVGEDAGRKLLLDGRHEARDGVQAPVVLAHATARDAAEEPDRVGMPRLVEDGLDRTLLDKAAGVQDPDPLAHL